MTPEQHAERSGQLLGQFSGMDSGEVISILATALQLAICYGAKNKDDAMDIIACLMVDADHDMPRLYDFVQDRRAKHKGN